MSVVRGEARRRWLLVAAGIAALCLVPAVLSAWPAPAVAADPVALREKILASVNRPHSGYADTHGLIQLPDLPALQDVKELFGTMRLRSWYASPESWRVAVLQPTGERDTYQTTEGLYTWDYEKSLTILTLGTTAVRPPSASDLLPPDLARRLLSQEPSVSAIESRRIAGIDAAGLRINPTDPSTTIGRVDIWADPNSGLPVQVEVSAKGGTEPVFTSRFLEVDQGVPAPEAVAPQRGTPLGFTVASAEDIARAINNIAPLPLPETLAGRPKLGATPGAPDIIGLAAFGSGLSTFAVIALPGDLGVDAMNAARDRGGLPVQLANGRGYETSTTLVNGLIIQYVGNRPVGERRGRRIYLLAGPVSADLLQQAAGQLLAYGPAVR